MRTKKEAEKWVQDNLGNIDRETKEIAIRAYEAGHQVAVNKACKFMSWYMPIADEFKELIENGEITE